MHIIPVGGCNQGHLQLKYPQLNAGLSSGTAACISGHAGWNQDDPETSLRMSVVEASQVERRRVMDRRTLTIPLDACVSLR
jgi:hypothetical protein